MAEIAWRKLALLIDADNVPPKLLPSVMAWDGASETGRFVVWRVYGNLGTLSKVAWTRLIQEFALSAPLTEFVPGSAPPSIVPLRLPPSSKTKRSVAEPPVRFWMFVKPATKTGVGSGFSTKRLKYPPFGPSILHSVVASGPMIVLAPSPPSRTPLSRPLMSNVNVSSPAAASMSSILMKLIPCAVKAPSPLIAHASFGRGSSAGNRTGRRARVVNEPGTPEGEVANGPDLLE